jgi:hypothetical protein
MRTILKALPILLAFTFLMSGCTKGEDASTPSNDRAAKYEFPVLGKNWKEVGYVRGGAPTLTFNKELALQTLSDNMREYEGIEEEYTSVYIVTTDDGYNLIFEGDMYRTAFYIQEVTLNTKLSASSASSSLIAHVSIACTTSDCSSEARGCIGGYDEDEETPYCIPCENGGKCFKTSTISTDPNLASSASSSGQHGDALF